MNKMTEFIIDNDNDNDLCILLEPEAHEVLLKKDETVVVRYDYENDPITIRVNANISGELFVRLWPSDGDMLVTKNGKDVLDFL